jgi:hypothetical protein
MSEKILPLREEKYYDFISYLISSAYLMAQGEQYEEDYPSNRVLDFAKNLTQAIIDSGGFKEDEWPQLFIAKFDVEGDLWADHELHLKFLEDLMQITTEEVIRRAG